MHAYNKFWHANWIYPYNKLNYLFDEAENRKSKQTTNYRIKKHKIQNTIIIKI